MSSYPTMPNPSLQPNKNQQPQNRSPQGQPIPRPHPQQHPMRRPTRKKRRFSRWLLVLPVIFMGLFMMVMVMSMIGLRMAFANKILPQVSVAGFDVGGMTVDEAKSALTRNQRITLVDGERTWNSTFSSIGLILDTQASAENAFAQGHGEGGLTALFAPVDVAPVIQADLGALVTGLEQVSETVNLAPVNAGVQLVNGQVQATEPEFGRQLNIDAMVAQLGTNADELLADGELELIMQQVQPAVMDASPLVREAERLLTNPLDIRVYDPVSGDSDFWSVSPTRWSNWISARSNPDSPIGLSLDVNPAEVEAYLSEQSTRVLDASRTVDISAGVESIRDALAAGRPQDGYVEVQHLARTHVVQSGETITSIAWDYGIPYLYIVQANDGLEYLSVGQTINIPPADIFLEYPTNPNKRIEVDLSDQRTRVYENGQLIYDWSSSTGISDSPTWTGVYQVISHEPNAYAANWNLYMPNFIGIYQPVPNADFTNGFHGFPTRGGGQILWENSLGTRVTYGCVLLSNQHVQLLYDWAETGVVVEITQ